MGMTGEGSGQAVEDDEVECLLANQIYKVRPKITRPTNAHYSDCLLRAVLGRWWPSLWQAHRLGSLATRTTLLQYTWLT